MTTERHQPEETSDKKGFGKRQIIATVLTLGVLVLVFAVVFPQFANYQEAWDALQDMSTGWIITLIVATVVVIVIYAFPFQAALPGLTYWPAFKTRQTSFMISNTIPAGGAIGLGVQYGMLNSYGFGPAPATATIGITSVWNTFITLTLPVLALLGLAIIGEINPTAALVTLIGVVAVAIGIGVFALILRSEDAARRLGRWADKAIG